MPIRILILLLALLISSCSQKPVPPVILAMNPWPGYEFLYLAEQKGFFKQVGANIQIVQLASLSDAQRSYTSGQVDGFSSTLVEAAQAEYLGGEPLKIVLVADYSNGGDVIVSQSRIDSITALKGKKVGCEVAGLGIYLLHLALQKYGLNLEDIELINIDQAHGYEALQKGQIDAFVSYPPNSIAIIKDPQFHQIFDSSEIPYQIVDVVTVSEATLRKHPKLQPQLQQAWQLALDYFEQKPEEATAIMARREGITPAEFSDTLSGLKLLTTQEQAALFKHPAQLQQSAEAVCHALVAVDALVADCSTFPNIVYQSDQQIP